MGASRLIKGEVDDPFDDRFHAPETDGSLRRAPGHISWNVWLDDAWRQLAIIQGEGVEFCSELPRDQWNGSSHPGRIRLQTFRRDHSEPLTDALIGQGGMSIGGGGYGGGGLPSPADGLELWATIRQHDLRDPPAPRVIMDDRSGPHTYAIVAFGPFGKRSAASTAVRTQGLATLEWDSVVGADSYLVFRASRNCRTAANRKRREAMDRSGETLNASTPGRVSRNQQLLLSRAWQPPATLSWTALSETSIGWRHLPGGASRSRARGGVCRRQIDVR